jgi:TolB-like protein/Tfp pilus assembly protein PilF
VTATLAFQADHTYQNSLLKDNLRPAVRVGIAMGEVVIADNTVTGAGVVLAQRVEQLAEPRGLCITAALHEALPKGMPFELENLGEKELKGFEDPVRVYRVELNPGALIPPPRHTEKKNSLAITRRHIRVFVVIAFIAAIAAVVVIKPWRGGVETSPAIDSGRTPSAPAIAISPFNNMSNDETQDYFVVGVTEDIITDLSKVSGLRVIVFREEPPIRQDLVHKYKIRYLLAGSVRKLAGRVRINVRLVDNEDGSNVWTERYDRELEDIFTLQEEVAQQVVGALSLTLTGEELGQLSRSQTASFDAYDLFLQGQRHTRNITRESNLVARQLYERAIELDPGFARAYGALSVNHAVAFRRGWTEYPDKTLDLAVVKAEKAATLDNTSPHILWALGYSYLFKKEYQKAIDALEKAIHISPSYADAYGLLALINNNLGRYEQAAEQIRKAKVINPVYTFEYPYLLGWALYGAERYEEAIETLAKAIERNESALAPHLFLAASYVGLNQQDDAEWEIEQILVHDPEYTTSKYYSMSRMASEDELNRFLDALRKAGLPD